jgi:anti-sigma regulatory factor (Ser/Thr protein kinase)
MLGRNQGSGLPGSAPGFGEACGKTVIHAPNSARTDGSNFSHLALFYATRRQYKADVAAFVQDGLNSREPVLIAVPSGRGRGQALRDALGASVRDVAFVDVAVLGRNPARILPFLWRFVDRHPAERIWIVAEPAWPTRSAEEAREVCRHEALINQAFPGTAAAILCPYDSRRLAPQVIADARGTHPALFTQGQQQPNDSYTGPAIPPACNTPLPPPPATAEAFRYDSDLHRVRELVERHASRTGLPAERAADLVIAVSELAANTVRHTAGRGTVHVWHAGTQILCQVHDQGRITDPLAGHRPFTHEGQGQGLWVVNQLCDLVEVRDGLAGTTIRVRMNLKR